MALSFETIAILGATGPTGRCLARELAGRGQAVRVVARHADSLAHAFPESNISKVPGDALNTTSLAAAIEGCDLVMDCIGLPAGRMNDHPITARNIAAAVGRTGARCLQVSSYWCYMPITDLPISEDHPRRGGPHWARLRRQTEDILRDAGAAIIHLPDFFGPHVHTSTLQTAIREAVAGQTMNWIGRADTMREYAYIPDAMRLAADLAFHEEAYGEDWVFPGSGPVSATQIAAMLKEILGREVRLRAAPPWLLRLISLFNAELRGFMPMVSDYVKPVRYDASKLASLIGPVSPTPYEKALRQTVADLSAEGDGEAEPA